MRRRTFLKVLLAITYNTNTLIVNPLIYLKFLVPFLILEKLVSKNMLENELIPAIVVSLFIYNIAYIINDYMDYDLDVKIMRRKKSFVFFERNFVIPSIPTLFFVLVGVLMFGWKIALLASTVAILSFAHSKFYGLKPVTFLLLRFLKISLPSLLLSAIDSTYTKLLLFSLSLFPVYNLKSYVEYVNIKAFNTSNTSKLGIIMSIVTSGISIYFCISSIKELVLYTLLFFFILAVVKTLVDRVPSFAIKFFKKILVDLGYMEVKEKSKELMIFIIYCFLFLGIWIWF